MPHKGLAGMDLESLAAWLSMIHELVRASLLGHWVASAFVEAHLDAHVQR